MSSSSVRKIGIVGYGQLGKFLVEKILQRKDRFQLAFIWNRTQESLQDISTNLILDDLKNIATRNVDLIVEVCHPCISKEYGEIFLSHCDYMVGSPTAFADEPVERRLRNAATCNSLYVPAGAFWGGEDISKMAESGTLKGLRVTMTKHPSSFKFHGDLEEKNRAVDSEAVTLYEGPVRALCDMAPHNVNTMAVASLAASNLGFDRVQGRLISDPAMKHAHVVDVEAFGPGGDEFSSDLAGGSTGGFCVSTRRYNPAKPSAVTGSATFYSFWSSLLRASGKGPGLHLC